MPWRGIEGNMYLVVQCICWRPVLVIGDGVMNTYTHTSIIIFTHLLVQASTVIL